MNTITAEDMAATVAPAAMDDYGSGLWREAMDKKAKEKVVAA